MKALKLTVFAVIGGIVVVTLMKFAAALITGSAAVLAESLHSAAEALDAVVVYVGMKRGSQSALERRGASGGELRFWASAVSMTIFAVTGSLTILLAAVRAAHPVQLTHAGFAYAVLGTSALLETFCLTRAYRDFRETVRAAGTSTFTAEAGRRILTPLLGLLLAFCGVLGSHAFGFSGSDEFAALAIGGLLLWTSYRLGRECWRFAVEEPTQSRGLHDGVIETASEPECVTVHLALAFRTPISSEQAAQVLDSLERISQRAFPEIQHSFVTRESREESDSVFPRTP